MKLGHYIELDRQLTLDSCAGEEARVERDRRIGRTFEASGAGGFRGDQDLLREWVNQVEPASGPSLGALMEAALRWTGFLLVMLGLVAGVSAAAALLRYDGSQPINVLFFLGVIVGVQLLLLPLLILTFVFRSHLRNGFRLFRGFMSGLLMQVLVLLSRCGASPEKTAKLRADLGALRAGNSLYARVQPLLVFLLMQLFGLAFNVAVAGTLLFFVFFSDLTFSWATTVRVEPEQIYRITSILAAPWAGLFQGARPSLELVEATRFIRLEGAFATAAPDAALRAGGWWPFLLAATITYGLLPRLLAFAGGVLRLRAEMRRAVARSAEVQALKERLRTPLVRVDADTAVEPERVRERERPRSGAIEKGLRLAAVFWAYDQEPPERAVSKLVGERLGATVVRRLMAGGIAVGDDEIVAAVGESKRAGQMEGIAVFFEPFEPPKTDARRFLSRLREAIGPSVPIVIFLAEFAGDETETVEQMDWNAWSDAVSAMGDPFLLLPEQEVAS